MVGQLKEDVAEWYQGLSAHMRIEAMCTLIDLSMPFEIRFIGSLIEHLGRKDFGSLRDAEAKANSFANANPEDKKKLLKSLGEVTTACLVNGTQYVNPLMHPNNFNDSPANRPSPTHTSDVKGRHSIANSDTLHGADHSNDHGIYEPSSNCHDSVGPKGNSKGPASISNHIGCSSEETESMCIVNDHKRRRLILYVSVLAPTNHDGANLYYTVLSDIEDSSALTWLEELDKDAQEEVSLLYTLASRHPAFTFEQRMFLAAVANRVNEFISSKICTRGNTTPQQTAQAHNANPGTHPVYFNHAALPHGMDPKYAGYFYFSHPPLHIQQTPHQPSPVSSNGEQIRNTAVTGPFPAAYTPFGPYFLSHHHPAALPHHTALNPQYTQSLIGSSIPIPSASVAPPSGPSNMNPVVSANNSAVGQANSGAIGSPMGNHQGPPTKGPISQPPMQVSSSSTSNSLSQQSCLSTPSRTSSSVPCQSEVNSVDGDSTEESSENCDWNSPESSPFESPPQSLTPSRSQSPPSGVSNSASVQAVSLSGHSSTFLVTSSGNSVPYGGPINTSSSSSSSTVVKTEIHTSSALVISAATSSSVSCPTSAPNNLSCGGGGIVSSNVNSFSSINNGVNTNKVPMVPSSTSGMHNNPSAQVHHPPPPRGGPGKNPPTSCNNGGNQSFSSHPPGAVVSSSVIAVSQQQQQQGLPQQMMGPAVPVHMQQNTVLTSVNNVGGIVSHSMSSSNPPLAVAFAQQTHGAHNSHGNNANLPPPSQSGFPCFPHMTASVSFGGMNPGAYRGPSGVLTRNPFVPPQHAAAAAANALLANQMVIKGSDIQRGHNVHNSHRPKPPLQNTPKRRSNMSGTGHMPGIMPGSGPPHTSNSQSTSGKGDEVSDSSKDSRTNEIVVSANPSSVKGAQQQQQERTSGAGGGKSYHQHVTNGLVNPLPNSSAGASGVLPANSLPNISGNNGNSVVIVNNCPPQSTSTINSSSTSGGQILPTTKCGEESLLGEGTLLDNYPVNQLPYHINGPQIYGHPSAPYIQIPNGYMTSSSFYQSPGMGAGGHPVPPSTEIMMNPAGVPQFSFPFTIPQSFSSPPTTGNKGISSNNSKDTMSKSNSHVGGNGGNAGGVNPAVSTGAGSGGGNNGPDTSSKPCSNQHDGHVSTYPLGFYTAAVPRTPSQPTRNNRGVVILDIGGALGNNSVSPVNVDVAVMPPMDEFVEPIIRPRKISCYNCGANTHLGPDCKEGSMEEMTRHQFRVNYSGPTSVPADGKDGD